MEISFVKAKKSMACEIRHRVSMCKNIADLEKTFSEMCGKVIGAVIGSDAKTIPLRGIVFDAAAETHYKISEQLDREQLFREAWYRSDLPVIIGQFARSVWHHYLHLMKTAPRANVKIRI